MTDLEYDGTGPEVGRGKQASTSYSGNVFCGICGAPVRNVPVMYERMGIDWRCAKCLRRDKPMQEEHTA